MADTNVILSFPAWFYGAFSIGIFGIIFYLGALHFQIKGICKEYPKVQQSLIRISEILL